MDVHQDSVGGFFVEKRGNFAIDGAGDPQQGQLVREREFAVDIVPQFSREVSKSEGCHTWLLDVMTVWQAENYALTKILMTVVRIS